ncbi:MAG: diadenylate cyclase [Planctomycetales bacterium]|nr:diadenylate cyclase [Planctomycetales bacterium]MCA9166238.1 diadenylate cyclase [Planctomycetales bacterium]
MSARKSSEQFEIFCRLAAQLYEAVEAEALLVFVERPVDWETLKRLVGSKVKILLAADSIEHLRGAEEAQLKTVLVNMPDAPVYDKLTQALLAAIASEYVPHGADVLAIYSGFEAGRIDSLSCVRLEEHLGRLTARDLQKLETKVPLDTLKAVVDLAIEIGREGREGKPVGTIFVVGDSRNVLKHSEPLGFDPVKGYSRAERSIMDQRVREAIKEIAPLDGAVIVSSDGTVQAACRYLNAPAANVTLSKGLGARHWAAAAITKRTKAVAVTVSESNGTVRLFHRGEVLLRVEPFRRAMKWKDFENDPPTASES